jgi:hypothetical protein
VPAQTSQCSGVLLTHHHQVHPHRGRRADRSAFSATCLSREVNRAWGITTSRSRSESGLVSPLALEP